MWSWLRKRKKSDTGPKIKASFCENASDSTDSEISSDLGALAEDMKRKGYQGPFVNFCDGIQCVTFHGPQVSMEPAWIDINDNPFQMRVVDCEQFCSDSFLFAMGDEAQLVVDRFDNGEIDKDKLCQALPDSQVTSCLLGYPKPAGDIPDGQQTVTQSMESLWNIFQFDGYFYFTRSWTGQLRHRAKVEIRGHAMFVTAVETSLHAARNPPYANAFPDDKSFGVRQVDFLIKALLFGVPCPAPLPKNAPTDAGGIALYAFTEYGRIGCYPTFDDTTEYRLCINGVRGRFKANPDNLPLVNAISAVKQKNDPEHRQRLHTELRKRSLKIAFTIPDEELQKGDINSDMAMQFSQQEWNGEPCFFAYTDTTYRVEPSHGCMNLDGKELADFVRRHNENACVVINPEGPVTWRLDATELSELAD